MVSPSLNHLREQWAKDFGTEKVWQPLCTICSGAAQNLVPFWSAIFETFSNICSKEVRPDPGIALFGVAPGVFALTGTQCDALAFLSLSAGFDSLEICQTTITL